MAKVCVVLSGCGVFDGSEIHEATLTLLHLNRAHAEVICAAPDIAQTQVVDHSTKSPEDAGRNVLCEAARIARGEIRDLAEIRAEDIDALVIPGGFGAAISLSNFESAGAEMEIVAPLAALLDAMLAARKPVAALCIAPPLLARALQQRGVSGAELTIGEDEAVAGAIEAMGQRHVKCPATGCVVDRANLVVTTPAYMLASGIAEMNEGVEKTVQSLLGLL